MPNSLVALTGSTGRVGPYVARELLRKGHSLRLLVRRPKEAERLFAEWLAKGQVEIVHVDLVLAGESELTNMLKGCETLVHLAGLVDYTLPWEAFMLGNYEVTKKLAHSAKKAGIHRFVFASSTAVYGNPRKEEPVGEHDELKPVSPYGWSKFFAEDAVKRSGIEHVILRPCVIYGPGVEEGFVPTARAVQKGKMKLIGSGENRLPVVNATDVARAFALAVDSPKARNQVFNVCGPVATQKEFLNLLAQELHAPPVEKSIPNWLAFLGAVLEETKAKLSKRKPKLIREHVRVFSEDREFSTKHLEKTLGWKARVAPREGIREFVKWFKSSSQVRA